MDPTILYVIAAVLVVVGVLGTVLPVIPGALLIFVGLALAAWADDFARVGPVGLSIIGALGLASWGADLAATVLGARRVGASPLALAGATIGGLVGLFFGFAGLILGPFAGAVGGELIARRNLRQAGIVGLGTWLGLAAAAVIKVILAFLMIGTFVAFYMMNGR